MTTTEIDTATLEALIDAARNWAEELAHSVIPHAMGSGSTDEALGFAASMDATNKAIRDAVATLERED